MHHCEAIPVLRTSCLAKKSERKNSGIPAFIQVDCNCYTTDEDVPTGNYQQIPRDRVKYIKRHLRTLGGFAYSQIY